MTHSLPWNVEYVVEYCQTSHVRVALCDRMHVCMRCLCMDTKGHHQALVSQFPGLIAASFHYLESVGKYNEAYQTNQSLEICE